MSVTNLSLIASTVEMNQGIISTGAGATLRGTAGETITAGEPLYLKSSDSRYWKADANASLEAAAVAGIALHASLAGQPIVFLTRGALTIGAAVAVGTLYYLSATVGMIGDNVDPDVGTYVSLIGIATTAAIITVSINNTGVLKVS